MVDFVPGQKTVHPAFPGVSLPSCLALVTPPRVVVQNLFFPFIALFTFLEYSGGLVVLTSQRKNWCFKFICASLLAP